MALKPLPVGIQGFEKLIQGGYTYIDKTSIVYELASTDTPYFLSRPRRFGKSLLISTLDALFSGKRELFKDLWIEPHWDWTQTYPVVRLDMGAGETSTCDKLVHSIHLQLRLVAERYGIDLEAEQEPANILSLLITRLAKQQGKVVVLVDEYDKPLLDQIVRPEVAEANRELLRSFYGILKAQDANLRFVLLTGVSKFSKVSVFSGLNNLKDISLSKRYAALLGYTREELTTFLGPHIESLAQTLDQSVDQTYAQIKHWYDGYRFSSDTETGKAVYNPFSVLRLLDEHAFAPHWFSTGTPSFLFKLIQDQAFDVAQLEDLEVSASSFEVFELKHIKLIPTLYQAGYLTVKAYESAFDAYHLGFPNYEVRRAFADHLLRYFSTERTEDSSATVIHMAKHLVAREFDHFRDCINELLNGMPYDLFMRDEKHFASLLYLMISMSGLQIQAEVHTKRGRADAVIETQDAVFIFEFKRDQSAEVALDQIREKQYYARYVQSGKTIYLAGINYHSETRLVDDCRFEAL